MAQEQPLAALQDLELKALLKGVSEKGFGAQGTDYLLVSIATILEYTMPLFL